MINALVAVQILTMLVLGGLWLNGGDWRRATAQALYAVATFVLFAKVGGGA